MRKRDDFPARTKQLIGYRAGWLCSNPNCNRPVVGANTNKDIYTNVGIVAHITAASKNGPRYNSEMTPTERKSANNGILLCPLCATIIDKDPDLYPITVLQEWKKKRESASIKNVNQIFPGY